MLAVVLAALGFGAIYAATVPMPDPHALGPTRILASDGALVTTVFPGGRDPVPYSDLPASLKDAIVATEDHTFWTNSGLDPRSMARALIVDVTHGRILEGGSTLTQQLAKNLFLTQSRSIGRKFMEVFLTLRLAATYSKPEILDLYFNNVYFGEGAWGIENAAETYFGVHTRNLSLAQSALLAGLVNAPSAYDPFIHPKAALARRSFVLSQMVLRHMISKAAANVADAQPLDLSTKPSPSQVAPYFVGDVLDTIAAYDPGLAAAVERGGYTIRTTLNLADQEAADAAMAANLPPGGTGPEGAIVALDAQTGGIVAMVGGRNYTQAPFNRATSALRQPGSAFKPITYAALLATGKYTAASVMDDAPVSFPGPTASSPPYAPQNFDQKFHGPMIIRRALMISDNVVAVKWLYVLGIDPVVGLARSLGITTPLSRNLTLTLGSSPVTPLEMARVYAAFANGGYAVRPYAVEEVVNPEGRVVYTEYPHLTPVLSPQVAFILTNVLESVLAPGGTGAGLADNLDFQVAGKTGTSNSDEDGWFVGYSSRLVAATWVGYDAPKPLTGTGSMTAGPIWADFMAGAEDASPPPDFPIPPGVVPENVSTIDGLVANGTSPTSEEWFIDGTQPTAISPIPYYGSSQWPDATALYYAAHGPDPADPRWNQMMDFTKASSPAAASPH